MVPMIFAVLCCSCAVSGAVEGSYREPVASLSELSPRSALRVLSSDMLFYGSGVWPDLHSALINDDVLQQEFLAFAIDLYGNPQSATAASHHPIEDVDWEHWHRRAQHVEESKRLRREAELRAAGQHSGDVPA
eukprot:7010296-Pyramimonas_sp.AAC.1